LAQVVPPCPVHLPDWHNPVTDSLFCAPSMARLLKAICLAVVAQAAAAAAGQEELEGCTSNADVLASSTGASVLQVRTKIWPFTSDVQCNDTEVSCPGAYWGAGGICVPVEQGCPVTCQTDHHTCHIPPTCEACIGANWCSPSPCPVICTFHELQCEKDDGGIMCAPKKDGCPITCPEGQHKCHEKVEGGQGNSWCSASPCTTACSATEEVSCLKNDGSTFCAPKSSGCPVSCASDEHPCHSPPSCESCLGTNWCSATACSVLCKATEVSCVGSNGTDICLPLESGCPVNCPKDNHKCHTPPDCQGCLANNWCSVTTCPVACKATEVSCAKADGGNFCALLASGCPVTCTKDEHKCNTTPAFEGDFGSSWCSAVPCPKSCNATKEISCPKKKGGNKCVAKEKGCPVTCADGQFKCRMSAAHEGSLASNWCSATPCPVTCNLTEMVCPTANGSSTCADRDQGCPVECASKQHACHLAAASSDSTGTNWCSESACPVTCNATEIPCQNGTCVPAAQGCAVNCSAGDYSCHTPGSCNGCAASNWCSSTTCPVACNSTEISCAKADSSNFCVPMRSGCPVDCAKGEHDCHEPPTSNGSVGSHWCSVTACP